MRTVRFALGTAARAERIARGAYGPIFEVSAGGQMFEGMFDLYYFSPEGASVSVPKLHVTVEANRDEGSEGAHIYSFPDGKFEYFTE